MSDRTLQEDETNQMGGTVLLSQGSGWMRPTGVFLPDSGPGGGDPKLTVLLWFHGFYVKDVSHLFYREETKLLRAVLGSGKSLVLVAPHLGWYQDKKHSDYNAGALGGGTATETYLDQVLGALADWYAQSRSTQAGTNQTPNLQIADLYVAGHSGGGNAIRNSVGALGRYTDALRECWGFDCLYSSGQTWYQWATTQKGRPLYFYYGTGTQPAAGGHVLDFWKLVYGTLKRPLPSGGMSNVFLAPALPGTEMDRVAFQSAEDIRQKPKAGNRYEEVRKRVDPLIDDAQAYWSTIIKLGLKGHYQVVSGLLGPRIQQSL